MDVRSRVERAKTKAFYKLLVDRLGADLWEERKAAYVKRIREKEAQFDIRLPIEPQLFTPIEGDIDWYIMAAYLSHDFPFSDVAYSTRRIFPYAMAIGAVAEQLREVPHVNAVLDKMLANNSKPETQIFELLTASFYLKNGYQVSFIPENSITWPDGKTKKSPDMLVKLAEREFYVECKRADKQTKYAQAEEQVWADIWAQLSHHMLKVAPWSTVDLVFHDQLADVTAEQVIKAVDLAIKAGTGKLRQGAISAQMRAVDKVGLKQHYRKFRVRADSPQQELLVFGNIDSNEKRSIATVAERVIRPGTNNNMLNIFVKDVAKCVGAQWRCDHEASLGLRSRHFKGLVNDGVSQIPPDKNGVVHIWYETREGIEIEELRRDKNIENITTYNASETSVWGVLMHGVNYYPFEDNYEWAETVQDFGRVPDLMELYPRQSLMLGSEATEEVEGATHWGQDKAAKITR
ncbi:hypothetical protein JEU09_09990 [Pseudomonas aeruginosa]|uniref:hypothetical protein n=2 Tax=Pseudomonas aeruginosa TaxID=287 RepID=UPI000FECF997|nr:hypothetical protein [Pseudomonas aeruginosa]MBI7164730.1 hypothetical protein [Pseudomonas aeruginosa]MCO1688963.1 hypothetical protein [Pseudomonas aeruginosa]MCO1778930.1 hypothetical protein [Pseudomonas aeruginosa]MCO1793067.1 hypothetical protein [Pseudomonas aeruginosa]MCO1802353.1 hypothetical protein [Pseudomonas aeruginosa]